MNGNEGIAGVNYAKERCQPLTLSVILLPE